MLGRGRLCWDQRLRDEPNTSYGGMCWAVGGPFHIWSHTWWMTKSYKVDSWGLSTPFLVWKLEYWSNVTKRSGQMSLFMKELLSRNEINLFFLRELADMMMSHAAPSKPSTFNRKCMGVNYCGHSDIQWTLANCDAVHKCEEKKIYIYCCFFCMLCKYLPSLWAYQSCIFVL